MSQGLKQAEHLGCFSNMMPLLQPCLEQKERGEIH